MFWLGLIIGILLGIVITIATLTFSIKIEIK